MLLRRDAPAPNHGTVIVTLDGRRYVADASILSGRPLALLEDGETPEPGPLPASRVGRRQARGDVADGPGIEHYPCRIDRIGAGADKFDELHRRTRDWSPFDLRAHRTARARRDKRLGSRRRERFVIHEEAFEAAPIDGEERARYLADELGINRALAARVPPDRPVPPRPD